MRTTEWLGYDFIHEFQLKQILCSDLQCLGGLRRSVAIFLIQS